MMTTSDHGSTAAEWALVLLVIACGLWLRGRDLGSDALLIDEGESAVDAMTILESGTPGDRYLGLPHFENTLLTPWPESAEYEFRDSSHSPLGHTIYHGWLPLYAIAASLRLAGIQPDAPPGVGEPLRPRYTRAQMNRRAAAARAPSVLFAALFLAALYASGRALHGREAGLLALTVGAFSTHCISIARMARYYSATLAFTTLGIYLLYRLCRGAGRGSCLTLAMTLVLLFHCNTLAFLVLAAASLAALPIVLRAGELRRGGVALGVLLILLGTLPWAWATGFLTLVGKLPAARDHLDLPSDLLAYVLQRPVVGLLFLAGLATAVAARLRPGTESTIGRALAAGRAPLPFLLLILALAYSIFMALIPAASFFPSRLTLLLLPAGLLLGAVLGALGLRAIAPRRSQGLCIALTLSATLFMTVRSSRPAAPLQPGDAREAVFDLIEQLRRQPPAAGTRLYSTPQQQFPLCFYTGLPVQSVAPVRAAFFAEHPGAMLVIETYDHLPRLGPGVRLRDALPPELELDSAELYEHGLRLRRAATLEALALRCASVRIPQSWGEPRKELAPWMGVLLERLAEPQEPTPGGPTDFVRQNPAIFRGMGATDVASFWPIFFYRFVDPAERSGAKLNYARRVATAEAQVLPSSWVIFRCPAR